MLQRRRAEWLSRRISKEKKETYIAKGLEEEELTGRQPRSQTVCGGV